MKIIEALKQIKDINRRIEELKEQIAKFCMDMDYETPVYENQAEQIKSWIQSRHDLIQEILRLKKCIQVTNLLIDVTIKIGDNTITKSIAEWIVRRQTLSALELQAWEKLGQKPLKEGTVATSTGEKKDVKIRRYFSTEERDKMVNILRSEPILIDSHLEITNAITDLLEVSLVIDENGDINVRSNK